MLIARNYGPVAGRAWFIDRAQGGGQILERGSHHVDLKRAIAGEIAAVQAVPGNARLSRDDRSRGDIEDVLVLLFHFQSGAVGSVSIAWSAAGQPELYSLDVIATDASIWLELGPTRFRVRGAAASAQLNAEYGDPFDRSITRFLEAVQSGDPDLVFCPPDDALRTLRVALACERALIDGGTVVVSG